MCYRKKFVIYTANIWNYCPYYLNIANDTFFSCSCLSFHIFLIFLNNLKIIYIHIFFLLLLAIYMPEIPYELSSMILHFLMYTFCIAFRSIRMSPGAERCTSCMGKQQQEYMQWRLQSSCLLTEYQHCTNLSIGQTFPSNWYSEETFSLPHCKETTFYKFMRFEKDGNTVE